MTASVSPEDDAILERIKLRCEAGVTDHRQIRADEMMPLIRAAIGYREIAGDLTEVCGALALEVEEARKRTNESMCLGDPRKDG